MTAAASPALPQPAIDPETLTLLREVGIDPAVFLQRQAELATWRRSPEEEAKLAAEREALLETIEALNAFYAEHGYGTDGEGLW